MATAITSTLGQIDFSKAPLPAARDRFSMTLFIALVFHSLIILGISFDLEDKKDPGTITNMEITLVHNKSDDEPDDADYLAQANQVGGGNTEDKIRPSSPFSNPLPTPEDGIAPNIKTTEQLPKLEKQQTQFEILTAKKSPFKTPEQDQKEKIPLETKKIDYQQAMELSQSIARLNSEIDRLKQTYQKNPTNNLNDAANARRHVHASYIEAWMSKIKRIGRQNIPMEVVRNKLDQRVLVAVEIGKHGELLSAKILRSSANKTLDEAAIKIIHQASPYAPLPKEILAETEVLSFTRYIRFHVRSDGVQTTFR